MTKRLDQNSILVEASIVFGFITFGLLGILQHEMWRDELQSWMLARDSSSIANLFQNMVYEGHPALWHLCLYGLSRITSDPLIMQIFHLVISTGIVCLIVKASPLSRVHKFLLSFSYFIFFEYTFISRNYNLGILLSFLFCAIYARLGQRYLVLGAIILLIANTNAYSFIISLSLALFIVLDAQKQPRWRLPARLVSGLAIAGFGWIIAGLQIMRGSLPSIFDALGLQAAANGGPTLTAASSGVILGAAPLLPERADRFVDAIADIWKSYTAVPAISRPWFWNSNVLDILSERFDTLTLYGVPIGTCIAFVLSLVLVFAFAALFSSDRAVVLTYLFGTSALVLLKAVVYNTPFARHWGHFFILLIICFWLMEVRAVSRHQAPSTSQNRLRRLLTVLLCLQAIAGVYAASLDYLRPFSAGEAAAAFMQEKELDELPIFGSRLREASVISGYLDVPIYYPEIQQTGSFWTYKNREIEDQEELVRQAEDRAEDIEGDQLLLVLSNPLIAPQSATLTFQELARFEDTISLEELYLYLAQRPEASQ